MRSTVTLAFIGLSLAITGACRGGSRGAADSSGSASAADSARSTDTATVTGAMPASIAAIGYYGENVYDMIRSGNWAGARATADSLRPEADSVPASATITFRELDLAITRKDRIAALRAANRLTQLGALLSADYHPAVPSEVTLLDYDGRELEIGAATGDRAALRETVASMRRDWNAARPQVLAQGGASEATRFDALVAQAEAATAPADYARLATPVLDAVDTLEQVFTRVSPRGGASPRRNGPVAVAVRAAPPR